MSDLDFWEEQERYDEERDAQEYEIERAYQQGRADAYDEIIEHIKLCEKEAFDNGAGTIGGVLMATRITVEQMKEQKNETT